MTRKEAICHIMSETESLISQFGVSQKDFDDARAETHEALLALGVTDDEIESAGDE